MPISVLVVGYGSIGKRHLEILKKFNFVNNVAVLTGQKNLPYNTLSNLEDSINLNPDYIVIECWRKVDPASNADIYNDMFLKRYATALIKEQWGANLSKFNGVAMLGGVTMNGETIYSQAIEEKQRLEEQIQLAYELPPMHMVG